MSAQEAPRANRNGDPCPDWCAQTHDELLIPGDPSFGYMDGHVSEPVSTALSPRVQVRVRQYADAAPATVDVTRYMLPVLSLSADKASILADLLDSLPGSSGVAQLIDDLRAAAGIAGASGASDRSGPPQRS